jgi:hypothetical protein
MREQRTTNGGAGIVEQAQKGIPLCRAECFDFHVSKGKKFS